MSLSPAADRSCLFTSPLVVHSMKSPRGRRWPRPGVKGGRLYVRPRSRVGRFLSLTREALESPSGRGDRGSVAGNDSSVAPSASVCPFRASVCGRSFVRIRGGGSILRAVASRRPPRCSAVASRVPAPSRTGPLKSARGKVTSQRLSSIASSIGPLSPIRPIGHIAKPQAARPTPRRQGLLPTVHEHPIDAPQFRHL